MRRRGEFITSGNPLCRRRPDLGVEMENASTAPYDEHYAPTLPGICCHASTPAVS